MPGTHLAGGEIGGVTIRRKKFIPARSLTTERVHTFASASATRSRQSFLRATKSASHDSVAICALAREHEDRSRADLTEKSRVASIRSFRSSCLHGARKRARVASSSRRRAGTTNDNAAAAKPVSAAFVGVNTVQLYWTCEHGADQGVVADTLRCSNARNWRGERSLRLEAPRAPRLCALARAGAQN